MIIFALWAFSNHSNYRDAFETSSQRVREESWRVANDHEHGGRSLLTSMALERIIAGDTSQIKMT